MSISVEATFVVGALKDCQFFEVGSEYKIHGPEYDLYIFDEEDILWPVRKEGNKFNIYGYHGLLAATFEEVGSCT